MVLIPRFEPEVIEAAARKHYRGDDEKVATTPLSEIIVNGVVLRSRYDKADELEAMAHMVEALGPALSHLLDSVWCDSKCTHCYEVEMKSHFDAQTAALVGQLMEKASCGHNGIYIKHGDQFFEVAPEWFELEE